MRFTPARLSLADMVTCTKWSPKQGKNATSCERALLLEVIQGLLKFVGRKAQFGPLLAVPDTPSILAGAAAPRPRRGALPVHLAALAQWERWICSGSAPEHEVLIIGRLLLMAWAGFRFADAQRTCPASLLPDRHVLRSECWLTKVSGSGRPFGDLGVLQ